MCSVCGCGAGELKIAGHAHDHGHDDHPHHHHGHEHSHEHGHCHGDTEHGHCHSHGEHGHDHCGCKSMNAALQPAHAHAPGLSPTRMVQIEEDILAANNRYAAENRRYFASQGILALNFVSSPGSGKTTLLTKTIAALGAELPVAVVEGDQQTTLDADKILATGAKAIQINTGKGCHLDAHGVGHALQHLQPEPASVLFIENVGNLVCPASFDLGEAHKVAILSVTEGEDKPLKYPDMFHAADLLLINKTDLLPYVDFDLQRCSDYALRINPRLKILPLSAKSGDGMEVWLQWLKAARQLTAVGYVA